ncbi:MAG: hypothetical protein ABSA01_06560, partial [Anaerolineales bacterium]
MRQVFQEYTKFLLRLILPNFYKDKSDSPTKIIIAGAIFFGTGPVVIILLSKFILHSLIWQILVMIITIICNLIVIYTILTVTSVESILKGAELALKNPPPSGETWIQLTDGDDVIWKGKEFTPPATKQENKQPFEIALKKAFVPSQYDRWQNWQRIYNDKELQEIYKGEGDYKDLKRP